MGKITRGRRDFSMKKRVWLFYGCIFSTLCALAFRIFTLSDQYLIRAAGQQSTVTVTVANTRGSIYDRNQKPLVNGSTEYRAAVTSHPKAIAALSGVLENDDFENMSQMLQNGRPAVVTLEKLAAGEGISLFQVPMRYEERVLAPHLLGYISGDESEGLTGLEAAFDTLLTSYNGVASVSYTVDANGKPLQGVSPKITNTTKNSNGGICLTIDADIQEITEDIAAKYIRKGAVVIMDPESGEILSLASLPTFHPGKVADVLQDPDSPLLNRALCRYNCGSVFKIVSAAAALESGISTNTAFDCAGHITVGDTVFHCHQRLGHGNMTMPTAFAYSCNSYFIQLMRKSGGDSLWHLASRLQFNSPISLCDGFQTESATLPSQNALQSPAVLANLSFGQGELTATPIHIAQLVAAIANGGKLVSPHIVKGYVDETGTLSENTAISANQQFFSETTASSLQEMMSGVLDEGGTGYAGRPLFGKAGAKTGTAETGWERGEGEKYPVVQSWFAGYYPADNPQYAIVVLAENADNTGAKTAPVFKEICDRLYQMDEE